MRLRFRTSGLAADADRFQWVDEDEQDEAADE
jgi:hypothetical protein